MNRDSVFGWITFLLLAGVAVAWSSCSNHSSIPQDPWVPLGVISGEIEKASEHRELVDLLRTNSIEFAGNGSKIVEVDVPASRFDLAVSILGTNHLVRDGIFLLCTNGTNPQTAQPH